VLAGKNDRRNLVFPFYLKAEEEDEPPSPDGVNGTTDVNGL
jgi:hypothetical protein